MEVKVESEITVKHLRNLLALYKEVTFKEMDGVKAIHFAEAFKYVLEVSNIIDKKLKGQDEDK